jgi:hypothetical protein
MSMLKAGGGVSRKRDGAWVSGRGGVKGGAGSYLCADVREWSSRHRGPSASKTHLLWNFIVIPTCV